MLNEQGKLIVSGRAVWPALNEPDEFKGKKTYKVAVAVPSEKAAPIIAFLESHFEEGYEELCKMKKKKSLRKYSGMPWSEETDRDGEETGNILFNCKVPAETKDGRPRPRPGLFDASGKAMDEAIGGGSSINVSIEPYVWFNDSLGAGLRLTLRGVQVLELRHGGGASTASSCGFESVEGFETAAAAMATSKDFNDEAGSGGDF